MYQLVIADDEKIIRQGLKNVVDWNELGFEVTELFTDGQEVIEYLEYVVPDVILTDIKMSHVSGIDVAKYVFDHKLPCRVVLISGYQEFDLALQGIKYGAEDYLLKPTSVENILETFGKLKAQLDVGKSVREEQKAQRERMEEALPLLEERFFADLVLGVVDSEEYIRKHFGILYPHMDVENSMCMLADIVLKDYAYFMDTVWEYSYDQFEANVVNFLKIYKKEFGFHMVFKSDNIIEVAGIRIGGDNKEEGICLHAMQELVEELEASFKCSAGFEIRRVYDNIFDIGSLKEDTLGSSGDEAVTGQHLREQRKLVMSNITMGNIVTAQKLFHNILEELRPMGAGNRNHVIIDLLSTMNEVIKEVNEKLSQSLSQYFNYSAILSMNSVEEAMGYCDRIFDRIKLAEEKKEYYDTNSLVNKAKVFIQQNIYRDISQEETANQLYICPSYLSRLFKKQTGENFTQYVTRMKIEKSIELLKEPQYKTYQVSEMLGYKTPRYFSRLFRVQTGMNPSEYRGKVLHLGGEYEDN